MALRSRMPNQAELRALVGPGMRLLSWASGPEGQLVAATTTALAAKLDEDWQFWGWEQVLRGGWQESDSALVWATRQEQFSCVLSDPGELPGVFRERVLASTVMTSNYDLDRGSVQLVARRSLADGTVTWLASASGGASLEDPKTAAFVVEQTDRLRREYGL